MADLCRLGRACPFPAAASPRGFPAAFPDLAGKRAPGPAADAGHSRKWCGSHGEAVPGDAGLSERRKRRRPLCGKQVGVMAVSAAHKAPPAGCRRQIPRRLSAPPSEGTPRGAGACLTPGGRSGCPLLRRADAGDGKPVFPARMRQICPRPSLRGQPAGVQNRRLSVCSSAQPGAGFLVERPAGEAGPVVHSARRVSSACCSERTAPRIPLSFAPRRGRPRHGRDGALDRRVSLPRREAESGPAGTAWPPLQGRPGHSPYRAVCAMPKICPTGPRPRRKRRPPASFKQAENRAFRPQPRRICPPAVGKPSTEAAGLTWQNRGVIADEHSHNHQRGGLNRPGGGLLPTGVKGRMGISTLASSALPPGNPPAE